MQLLMQIHTRYTQSYQNEEEKGLKKGSLVEGWEKAHK